MTKINITKIAQFNGHLNSIYALGLGQSKNTFYTGATDGFIVEWNLQNPDNGKLLVKVNRPVYSFLFLAEHNLLLAGTAQGNLHLIDLATNKEIRNIEAHQNGIYDIKLVKNLILTAGGDGKICVWNLPDFTLLKTIVGSNKSARIMAINNLHNHIAVGFSDNFIRIYNSQNFSVLNQINAHDNSVFALSYSKENNTLVSGSRDVMLNAFDVENNYVQTQNIAAHTLHINAINFNTDGTLFVTASMDKTIKIWDAKTFTLLKVIDFARNKSHTNSVNKVLWFSPTQFITCSDDKTAMVWEVGFDE